MARRGWFKLHRQIQVHWVWEKRPFSPGHAWIDLLIRTNWIDSSMIDHRRAEAVKVQKGETVCSIRGLAIAWGWSRTRTQRFLRLLAADDMIEATNEATFTRIKVLNWKRFQGNEGKKKPGKKLEKCRKRAQGNRTALVPSENPETMKETNPQPPREGTRNTAVAQCHRLVGLIESPETRDAFGELISMLADDASVPPGSIMDRVTHAMNAMEQLRSHPGLPVDEVIRYALRESIKGGAKTTAYTDKVIENAVQRWRDGKAIA